MLNFEDGAFKALRHLVAIDKEETERIAQSAIDSPSQIQLVDFVDQIGLTQGAIDSIRQQQDVLVPEERRLCFEKYIRAVNTIPSIPPVLSMERMNPFTQFENQPPILFGMGGGSKALCKGLPIDVLSMVLTAEKLRRELNLGRCRIICANGITYTNIPKNSDFSKENIDFHVLTHQIGILFGIRD